MSLWTAEATYGAVPATQPSGMAGPQPSPETSTAIRTTPRTGQTALFSQPSLWIVVILGLAAGLVHVSLRFAS